jgi:hypothetical protein
MTNSVFGGIRCFPEQSILLTNPELLDETSHIVEAIRDEKKFRVVVTKAVNGNSKWQWAVPFSVELEVGTTVATKRLHELLLNELFKES